MPSISDAQPLNVTAHQPTAVQLVPAKAPVKRGRRPKIREMPDFETSMDDADESKWELVKITKFGCKLCQQTFNHQPNLYAHQISAHGRQKKTRGQESNADDNADGNWDIVRIVKFACKLCGQTFNHQPNLYAHQISVHGRQKKSRGRLASLP